MAVKRTKTKRKQKRKKNFVELSLKSFFLWSLGLLFLIGWVFVLGILVGRGLVSYEDMKDQFDNVQAMVGGEDSSSLDEIGEFEEDPELGFYKELSTKKDEAAERVQPSKKKQEGTIKHGKQPKADRPPPEKDEALKERQLDIKKRGRELSQNKEVPPLKTGGGYTVQIASFQKRNGAVAVTDKLKNQGYPAYFIKVNIDGRAHYRVMCGRFKDKAEASNYQKRLAKQAEVRNCFVIKVD